MKYSLLLILTFMKLQDCVGQTNFGREWLIGGRGYYLKFQNNPPIHDSIYLTNITNTAFGPGKSCISDSIGHVILMSDGMNIYNRQGEFIENGDSLASPDYFAFEQGFGHYSQTSIFLPMENGKYYFVMPTCNDTNLNNVWLGSTGKAPYNQLLYSVIDMKANAGAGKVVARNIPLMENKEISKTQMMACRHSNGKDWWLLKMMGDSNNIATFLFTQDSLIDKGLQRMPFYGKAYHDQWGQMVFNQTGSRVATTSSSKMGDVFLADFDRCYGILSNYKKISAPILTWEEGPDTSTVGVAFSPNGRFLYVTKYSHVVQYDLQQDSWYVVSGRDTTYNNFTGFFNCSLAPDGKIYIGNFGITCSQMSTINNPDQLGAGCNFCPKCFRAIANSYKTLMSVPPCMPNYELGAQVCWPLEVNELETENFRVYPNPTFNEISVYVENFTKPIPAKLMNYVGQAVNEFSLKQQSSTISMDELPTGIYFLIIQGQVTKVVKE
jgi:hypothetical protein